VLVYISFSVEQRWKCLVPLLSPAYQKNDLAYDYKEWCGLFGDNTTSDKYKGGLFGKSSSQ
jgi:hypothetical protein